MADLQRGGNAPVGADRIVVRVDWAGPAGLDADISAYLLGEDGRVSGDHDMVFYNQPEGGDGAVRLAAGDGAGSFAIDLARIPARVARIPFCLTIEAGAQRGHRFELLTRADIAVTGGGGDIRFAVPRGGASEAAMVLGELYRRQGTWKFRAVGQGFDGGLAPLARSFGIDVDEAAPAPVAPAPVAAASISLEKKVEAQAPQLVKLAKTAAVTLAKKNLADVRAQVVLVLDRSGSMYAQYYSGDVQRVIDRILPLAIHFDDDGALDCWAFADNATQLTPVTLDNFGDYVTKANRGYKKWCKGYTNNEPAAIEPIIDQYAVGPLPAYVIFVSDGGIYKDDEIRQLMVRASQLPIFWQFVGIGGSSYGILEELDTMAGRTIDNAGFFSLDDIKRATDDELYDRLLNEFPQWLAEARRAGILR